MELSAALRKARQVVDHLKPWCDKIEIAGSIRREIHFVKDIEIVCVPKGVTSHVSVQASLLDQPDCKVHHSRPCAGFIQAVNDFRKVKGDPTGRYTQRQMNDGSLIDIFIGTADNFGYLLAIRTGSAKFSKRLVKQAGDNGFFLRDGYVYKDGQPIQCPDEATIFKMAKMQFTEPKNRNI